MTDPTRQTGVFKHTDDSGKERSIVKLAADAKVVIGTLAALGATIFGVATWFNGHVQSQAVAALAHELQNEESPSSLAIKVLLDERLGETEAKIHELSLREQAHFEDLKSTVWKATNPARQADSGEPPEDD